MKAHQTLVNAALALGYTVSVWDGDEWQVKRSRDTAAIFAAVDSVGEAQLRFRDGEGKVCGWALIVPELDDAETVADCSANRPWIDQALGF